MFSMLPTAPENTPHTNANTSASTSESTTTRYPSSAPDPIIVTIRQRRGVNRSESTPHPTLAMDSTVPKLSTPAAAATLRPTPSTRYGTRLKPTLLDASVPTHAVATINQ